MGIQFEKLKKNNFPTDRSILVKQGRVRGNKNIFKVGLIPLIPGPCFGVCISLFLMILLLPKFKINMTILILKLSISQF